MAIKENPAGVLLKVNKNMQGSDIKKMIDNHFRENEERSLSPNGRMQKLQESNSKAAQDTGHSIDSSINRNSFGNGMG